MHWKEAGKLMLNWNREREVAAAEKEGFATWLVYRRLQVTSATQATQATPATRKKVSTLGYYPRREALLRFAEWLEAVDDYHTYELASDRGERVATGVAKRGTILSKPPVIEKKTKET